MDTHYRYASTAFAAITAAVVLAGCDERANDAALKSIQVPTSTANAKTLKPAQQMVMGATEPQVESAIDDNAVTLKVRTALISDPILKSVNIGIETKNGAVTLTGTVDSLATREHAKQIAGAVSGVTSVIDQLTVKGAG